MAYQPQTYQDGLQGTVRQLVNRVSVRASDGTLCSASCAVYDTAWVAMVGRSTPRGFEWTFPACFRFLLDSQMPEGGWPSYASVGDGILNSLAALLALKMHERITAETDEMTLKDLRQRCAKAIDYTEQLLQDWDVASETRVGFEYLVPNLLELLEGEGITFSFPLEQDLRLIKDAKFKRFKPEMLYDAPSTCLHSLEAFRAKVDFDRLSHYKRSGSLMGSPSSSAAFLMNSSVWHDDVETYLHEVIDCGSGGGSGAVPSVFPIPIFELVWSISTLLEAGIPLEALDEADVARIILFLETTLTQQNGICGFAPGMLPDADDTAKTVLTLNLLGRPTSSRSMLDHFFSSKTHRMATYVGERNASFSANCNALRAILSSRSLGQYQAEIEALVSFLCEAWWNGDAVDKWNLSPYYSMMLLADCFVKLLQVCDEGALKPPSKNLLEFKVPVILCEILTRTLSMQMESGAWSSESSFEVTSYAILTLVFMRDLPLASWVADDIEAAILKGRENLNQTSSLPDSPQYLWIEKVAYAAEGLSAAYRIAAIVAKSPSFQWNAVHAESIEKIQYLASKAMKFFNLLPAFKKLGSCYLKLALLEGHLFLPKLMSDKSIVLQSQNDKKNAYLGLVPITWIIVNNHQKLFLKPQLLYDMMVLTIYNFRVDEYFDTRLRTADEDRFRSIEAIISQANSTTDMNGRNMEKDNLAMNGHRLSPSVNGSSAENDATAKNGLNTPSDEISMSPKQDIKTMKGKNGKRRLEEDDTVSVYIAQMVNSPTVQKASPSDQQSFRFQLREFLLSHIQQARDNLRFTRQKRQKLNPTDKADAAVETFLDPGISLHNWVHTTGAKSVSALMSFAYLVCLLGAYTGGSHATKVFDTAYLQYLTEDLSAHIANMSRLYNDWGSLDRDLRESNVNCVNFPEFGPSARQTHPQAGIMLEQSGASEESRKRKLKDELLELAEYERTQVDVLTKVVVEALERKGSTKRRKIADGLVLLANVAKLYGDMYLVKDLSNSVVMNGGEE